jgi:hypothetical protein
MVVARLPKRCRWCRFSFTSRLTLYYCVASPAVAAGTHRRHRQSSAPSTSSYLPCEKERVKKETRNRIAKKLASAMQYLVTAIRYPLLSRICYLFVMGGRSGTESENVNCQVVSNKWRRLSWSSFSANNVVVLYNCGPYLTLAPSISADE